MKKLKIITLSLLLIFMNASILFADVNKIINVQHNSNGISVSKKGQLRLAKGNECGSDNKYAVITFDTSTFKDYCKTGDPLSWGIRIDDPVMDFYVNGWALGFFPATRDSFKGDNSQISVCVDSNLLLARCISDDFVDIPVTIDQFAEWILEQLEEEGVVWGLAKFFAQNVARGVWEVGSATHTVGVCTFSSKLEKPDGINAKVLNNINLAFVAPDKSICNSGGTVPQPLKNKP